MTRPRSLVIETKQGRVIIGEHTDSAYICIEGGAAFLTEAPLIDAIAELRAIRERLRKG